MPSVLITGATGFIGSALCLHMKERGWLVKAAVHQRPAPFAFPGGVQRIAFALDEDGPRNGADLSGADAIIHLAGRAHVMKDRAVDPLEAFRRVNVLGTQRLARFAALVGIKRFVFVSSIGVNGFSTSGKPFFEDDPSKPHDLYAVSKAEAEEALRLIARETGMQVVIVRPPLVYGPGAPGNFSRLLRLIKAGLPLPLGAVKNLRSFIFLGNLVDALRLCVEHPQAAGETFLVSDGQDVSTPDLVRMIASALGRKAALLSWPPSFLIALSRMAGKSRELEKLTGTLLIDSGKIRRMLGWEPPYTLQEGIRESVKSF